jgi:hypothetical protein
MITCLQMLIPISRTIYVYVQHSFTVNVSMAYLKLRIYFLTFVIISFIIELLAAVAVPYK